MEQSTNSPLAIENKPKRFNLSIKRLISRFFLTGVFGIIFGIAMMPFMRTAQPGENFAHKVVIGGENMTRAVVLWGIFTLIVVLFTLWRKHFRMVSVFLVICWLVSILFVGSMAASEQSKLTCKRTAPYVLDNEFNRVLDLISQRMRVDSMRGSYLQDAYNFRSCLNIQYSTQTKDLGAEGLFFAEDPTLQNLKILVNPDYKNYDDLTISTILIHEITHVGQYVNRKSRNIPYNCYRDEAEAFTAQTVFLNQLNPEEVRSIFSRIRENAKANPAFEILLEVFKTEGESYSACDKLRITNNLSREQFSECVWTGTTNKIEAQIRADEGYREQCSYNANVSKK